MVDLVLLSLFVLFLSGVVRYKGILRRYEEIRLVFI